MESDQENGNNNNLNSVMECQNCKCILVPPILNCVHGHAVSCNSCHETCGAYQRSSVIKSGRNVQLEPFIAENATFKCQFESEGCTHQALSTTDELQAHLQVCDYRAIECNASATRKCTNVQLPFTAYIRHLSEIHNTPCFDYSDQPIIKDHALNLNTTSSIVRRVWPVILIKYENIWLFRCQMIVDWNFCIWFKVFGPKTLASRYLVELTLFKPSSTPEMSRKISWTMPVHSFRKSYNEIMRNPTHFTIPVEHLVQFCDVNNDDGSSIFQWNTKYDIVKL